MGPEGGRRAARQTQKKGCFLPARAVQGGSSPWGRRQLVSLASCALLHPPPVALIKPTEACMRRRFKSTSAS